MSSLSAVLHGSHILIREAEPMHDTPELLVYYWPTRFTKHDLVRFDGQPAYDVSQIEVMRGCSTSRYGYSLKFPGCGFWTEAPLQGDTKAHHVEHEPIPCPKVRKGIETRFRNGRWEKYLRSSGWAIA